MIQITNKSACTGCGACRDSCPTGAISMIADEEGFLYPSVEADKCIHCGKCDKRCPVANGVLKKSDSDFEILAYAA